MHQTPPASSGSSAPAWVDAELADPHASAEKAVKVRSMFSAIAGSYDLNNRVHSLWLDQAWRRRAVRTAAVRPGDAVLDVACGTGDLSQAFAATAATKVVGLDFTPAMLDHARRKQRDLARAQAEKLTYVDGDAQALPFADGSFDVVSIAFGIRNVQSPERALRWLNDLYCGWVMPRTATLISGDRSGAYRYLPASVGTFMPRAAMRQAVERAGFSQVRDAGLTLGICVCYSGVRA
jgi:demethylmenaquinone methyltransferase/2-methoxy-6-polyprenyl-1,4-benzoquinol methylase